MMWGDRRTDSSKKALFCGVAALACVAALQLSANAQEASRDDASRDSEDGYPSPLQTTQSGRKPVSYNLASSASGPVTIVVSLNRQELTVYDGVSKVGRSVVSTGLANHPTPPGVFSVIEKQKLHRSNIYSDAPMPLMQRITWSGVALHQGHVTGRPASHGCVRLPAGFAQQLFGYTKEGARVVISHGDASPAPYYGSAPLQLEDASKIGNPSSPYSAFSAETGAAGVEGMPGEIEAPPRLDIAQGPSETRSPPKKDKIAQWPVTILISRSKNRLYVRRAFQPLFDVPIEIAEPNRPFGAHLLLANGEPDSQVEWSVFSVSAPVREARAGGARDYGEALSSFAGSTVSDSLQRVRLTRGTIARLTPLIEKGAAIILSDNGAQGKESWDGTNFVVIPR